MLENKPPVPLKGELRRECFRTGEQKILIISLWHFQRHQNSPLGAGGII